MSEQSTSDTDRSIKDIAHDYLRAVEDHEAKKEELMAEFAEEYHRPGYLDDCREQLAAADGANHENPLLKRYCCGVAEPGSKSRFY